MKTRRNTTTSAKQVRRITVVIGNCPNCKDPQSLQYCTMNGDVICAYCLEDWPDEDEQE